MRFMVAFLAVVIGTAQSRADLGAFIAFLMIAMHFRTHPTLLAEYKTVIVTLLIGALWESLLIGNHVLRYEGNVAFSIVPMWVLAFWAALATTFNGCLNWGKRHLFRISALGGCSGALLGYAGTLSGIVHIESPVKGYLLLALGWALMAPFLFWLADYFSRTSEAIHRN